MKKDVKLYNMILPPFMLFFFVPTLWIVSALGNSHNRFNSSLNNFNFYLQEIHLAIV